MKILVICQYYYPEPFRITDICEELVKRGNNVTVVTGIPNYPMGEIYEGYRNGEKRDEIINGVNVHRCFTIGRKTGAVRRLLNYYSYPVSSVRYINKLKDDFDVVFVNQLSPVMMAKAGIVYKKKHQKKLVIYCLDLWPESLVAGGIERNTIIYNIYHKASSKIYKCANKILVTSKSFTDYFNHEFNIATTEYLPQYAESFFCPEDCTKIPNGIIDLMFAGNIGSAQSVKTIIEAARILRNEKKIRWHIVGDGSELENIQKLSREYELNSVFFHGRKSIEEMPQYYNMADAMLVTMLNDDILSLTLPGKVQTYMAAGKPIIGAIEGEAKKVIEDSKCGFCSSAEDAEALAGNARSFYELIVDDMLILAKNSYNYYLNNFSKKRFMEKLITSLNITK